MATLRTIEISDRAEWRRWLAAHHRSPDSVWLVTWKKRRGPYVSYDAVVEEALCFGWVDSRPRKLDEDRTMLLMSPRKPSSGWSAANKARVERLTAAGLMTPAGQAAVDAAKASGVWSKLDEVEALAIPDDLAAAFATRPGAAATFEAFPRSVKRGVLEWIVQAKRPQTRAARIAETADKAARGERANQWRRGPLA